MITIQGKQYRTVTRDEMRRMDGIAIDEYRIPGIILMENAGRSVAQIVMKTYREKRFEKPVLILCGRGNNGGDGFVIARHLHNGAVGVRVLFAGKPADVAPDSDAGVNLEILKRMEIRVEEINEDSAFLRAALDKSELVVDALLGTGLKGGVREPYKSVIETLNAASKYVIAVDIPSGLDCNEGTAPGSAVKAAETVTLGLPKAGFLKESASAYLGILRVGKISLPRNLMR